MTTQPSGSAATRTKANVNIPCPGCSDPGGLCATAFRCQRPDDAPCSRKGCGRPLSEHEMGVFCP